MRQKNKKSQVTIFLILGVVLIIIVTTLVTITRYVNKKTTSNEVIDSSQTTLDIQPIKCYIEECLSIVSEDGLVRLGKQGGYLFKSQGGTVVNYQKNYEGKVYVEYGGFNITYNILKPRFQFGNYYVEPEKYPWEYFPRYPDFDSGPTYFGKDTFGTNMMPDLIKSKHSIQKQLETFVDNNIDDCLDFSVFEEQGFKITEKDGSREITLSINENDIVFNMNYPLIVESLVSGEKTEIKDFLVQKDFKLKQLYSFINGLIENDISDVTFVIETGSSAGFGVKKIKGDEIDEIDTTPNNDDLIIITDENSLINGVPYQYYFMRKNRNPALGYIIEMIPKHPGDDRCIYDPEERIVDCNFEWWMKEPGNPECECEPFFDPPEYYIRRSYFPEEAHDPDKDDLTFDYYERLPKLIVADKDKEVTIGITQIVKDDGGLEDWQIVTFYVHWDHVNKDEC